MGIIVSNGDSFTYGDELEGSRQEVDNHHHHTYTHKLANKLDRRYVNLAVNGASNDKIYRRTFDFLMTTSKEIDLLVIMWSNFGRFEICEPFTLEQDRQIFIHSDANMNQIIPDHHSKQMRLRFAGEGERSRILKEYVSEVLTNQTQVFKLLSHMTQMQWVCGKLGIPIIQGVIHDDMYKIFLNSLKGEGFEDYRETIVSKYRMLLDECKIGLGSYRSIYRVGEENHTVLPMGHVCENAHTEFADMLYDIILEKEICY